MRRLLLSLLILVLFLVFSPPVSADFSSEGLNIEVEDKINYIAHYAEEYEIGNINYFQLNVHGHKIRSDLNLLLGGGIGNEWARIPKESIEKAFGTPADYTYWVWVDNKNMEKRFDEAMPWWERVIFDGRKVRIVFNAFPSAIEMENGTLFRYYSVDFSVRFKKEFNFDIDSMMKEVASLAADYNMTRTKKSGEALARKMLETQSIFGRYAQENSEQCVEIMESVFTPEEKSTKEKVVWWKFPLYSGSDFDVMVNVDMCEECEFHYINFMLDVEGRGPMNVFRSPELRSGKLENKIAEEYFQTLSIDDVQKEFEKTVFEVRDEAQKFDKTRSSDFPKKFFFDRFKVQQLNRILDGKYNNVNEFDSGIVQRIESGGLQGPGGCKNLSDCRNYCEKMENAQECRKFIYNIRVDALEKTFAGFNIEKTPHDRIWWERRVFENTVVRQDSWCRHVNDVQCQDNEDCANGNCIQVLGKNETEYVCNGVKQKKPCEPFVCNGRGYSKPCSEANITCGKNQDLTGDNCICKEGFKDCNNDGDCEPTKSCGLEICDDSRDNNNDGLVDCLDQTCNRQVCGYNVGKDMLCINKMCIAPEKEALPKEPEPVCGNHICEKGENEKSCQKDCVVCETYEPPECSKGKIVWKGKDNLGCQLPPICVVTEKECEKDGDCPQPKCGVSKCAEGGCLEGKTKKRECNDGSEIITAICSANEWIETGYDCLEAAKILPVIRPNETKSWQKESNQTTETKLNETEPPKLTIPNETSQQPNETIQPQEPQTELPKNLSKEEIPETVLPEKIAPEAEEEPQEVSGECVLMTDCGRSQDVCSNGNCVTLPIPVEEKPEKESRQEVLSSAPEPLSEKPSRDRESSKELQPEKTGQIQEPPAKENSPTGSMIANLADYFMKGGITGFFAAAEQPCKEECAPCDECNQDIDSLMKRVGSGEISGPGGCKNRMECDGYCQKEENKEECKTFLSNYGIETFDCWQNFCRECDKCKFKAGEFECKANQHFNMEAGFCECNEGLYDCNGDWEDGCESDKQCGGCQSKDDCAKDRCAPWGNVIQQFDCFKGEEWVEEKGVLRLEGQCRFYPTKKAESHLAFDMWGEPFFEGLSPIKESVERERGFEWCGWELENTIKERIEIQNSFTKDSLKWFFEEYVPSSPSEWEKHIGGIYDSYWRIVNNNRWTAENLLCLGRDKLPDEYKPIDVSYDTDFGSVRIWEAETTTDFFGKRMKILSPYMRIWVFPTKEFIKKEFQDAMESGMMPGPEGQQKPELSPSEIGEMKKDKKLMEIINSVSDKYGGEAKFLLNIIDENETVFNALITINPDTLIKFEPAKTEGYYDAKLTFDFDFFYTLIRTGEKEMSGTRTEYPPWEKEGLKIGDAIKGIVDGVKMWLLINSGVVDGSIKSEPSSSLSDGLTVMKLMFERGPQ